MKIAPYVYADCYYFYHNKKLTKKVICCNIINFQQLLIVKINQHFKATVPRRQGETLLEATKGVARKQIFLCVSYLLMG